MPRHTDQYEVALFIMLGWLFVVIAACLGYILHNEWKLYQVRKASLQVQPILHVWGAGTEPVTVTATQYLSSLA